MKHIVKFLASGGIRARQPGLLLGLAVLVVVGFVVGGCSKSGSGGNTAGQLSAESPYPVDLSRLTKEFASAAPSQQVFLGEILSTLRTKDLPGALQQFRQLEKAPKLTAEQKAAVTEVIAKLESLAHK